MSPRVAIQAVTVVALLGLTVPAAHAESWSAKDRRGDVRASRIDLSKDLCARPQERSQPQDKRHDITALTVDHGLDDVVVTVSLRDVTRNDRSTSYELHLRTAKHAYELEVAGLPRGENGPLVFLAFEPHYPDPADIENCVFAITSTSLTCDGLAAIPDSGANVLTVTIPRSCLQDPTWVRVACRVYGSKSHGPGQAFVGFHDTWTPRGVSDGFFLPPFGPRVRAG